MSTSLRERARETEPVLMSEELDVALPDGSPAALVFVFAVAAFFVAAILFGSGLARLPWLDTLGALPLRVAPLRQGFRSEE